MLPISLLLFISFVVFQADASKCYPDYCRTVKNFEFTPQDVCLIEKVQRGQDCLEKRFDLMSHVPPNSDRIVEVFLTAYIKDFGGVNPKATALNLTIDNVDFAGLTTRFQGLGDESATSACRHAKFHHNVTQFPLTDFHVSCPFSNYSFEMVSYRLEYAIYNDTYEYSRKLLFLVPDHRFLETATENNNLTLFSPFIYTDVSEETSVGLYIQPISRKYNVTQYKVWAINRGTNHTQVVVLEDSGKNHHIHHKFIMGDGENVIHVAALHPTCPNNGCRNTTSPVINILPPPGRLYIMIISVVWIPPVILYLILRYFQYIKKREFLLAQARKPKCLLVYSPTHMAHVNVMLDLARYLKCCNIDAMIDNEDIPCSEHKDPYLWCNESYARADIIIIAASPDTGRIAPIMYRNLDKHVMALLKENFCRGNKKYYALQFPYCKPDDIPKEARHFKQFSMPEDLDKLVRTIHQNDYINYFRAWDRDFVDSIQIASMQMYISERSTPSTEENDDFLLPNDKDKTVVEIKAVIETQGEKKSPPIIRSAPKMFKTDIEELNLLGESNDGDIETQSFNAQAGGSKFCIDTLNL
ncbi:hypothetical protein TKK_0003949 [Trichogramma kaykai]|uniref:SEFIR domain-containing protein n=1 Tax=Trichogramma kaykai TaxID=54128 RepID=A0ABD2XPL6_9HYME